MVRQKVECKRCHTEQYFFPLTTNVRGSFFLLTSAHQCKGHFSHWPPSRWPPILAALLPLAINVRSILLTDYQCKGVILPSDHQCKGHFPHRPSIKWFQGRGSTRPENNFMDPSGVNWLRKVDVQDKITELLDCHDNHYFQPSDHYFQLSLLKIMFFWQITKLIIY